MADQRRSVRATLPDGTELAVEVQGASGTSDVSAATKALPLDDLKDALSGVADMTRDALKTAKPDSAKVEFGLDVKVEAGKLTGLLVSGSGGASLKVTLEWKGDS